MSLFGRSNKKNNNDIAVIGIACRFPGARNTAEFWSNLTKGIDSVTDIPRDRWDIEKFYNPDIQKDIKTIAKKGGFIDGVDLFDAEYFRIKAERAVLMDPQQRLVLETTAEALNCAGYKQSELAGTRTGVFFGAPEGDYGKTGNFISEDKRYILSESKLINHRNGVIGNLQNMVASVVSYNFNLQGPSMVVNTMCSSAAVAVHLACKSILNGESEYAVAGGVQLYLSPISFIQASKTGVLSPDGKTRTFSRNANGYALSEGVGVVLLKKLDEAICDGDTIYAVIKATAVNSDGKTMSTATPNMNSQKKVIIEALENSKVDVSSIGYLEVNGTALEIGDPLEIKAAILAYSKYCNKTSFCAVGSVEPNIGHALHASGMARLIKVILSLYNRQIPPTLYCDEINPKINFQDSPFYPNKELVSWNPISGRRLAGINAFGVGGTNCHMILEDFNQSRYKNYCVKRKPLSPIEFNRRRYWITDTIQDNIVHNRTICASDSIGSIEKGKMDESNIHKVAEDLLKETLCLTAHIEGEVSPHEHFENLGLDSDKIIGITLELEKTFGDLPKTLFFEYQDIKSLAGYFTEKYEEKLIELLKHSALNNDNANQQKLEGSNTKSVTDFSISKKVPENTVTFTSMSCKSSDDDIAIIGLSGRYPQAENINEFWENIKNGKDCITEVPPNRWDFSKQSSVGGKSISRWGGFIDDIDKFDPLFFNISPKEAEYMDPQERIFLETVWHTLEDAGYAASSLAGNAVGVFVGVMYDHYQLYGVEETLKGNTMALGTTSASVANRVSYFFDFHGPSISINTMCSSSLTAIHFACESIKRGEVELAIAGGVNLSLHPGKFIMLSQGNFASSDGRCRSFGEGGDGYVTGEGAGAVLLKPLKKAVEDNDQIYAVIKGSAINHGGRTNGYTVPTPKMQGRLIADVLRESGIHPRTLSYIEAHGTGTQLGDPIEVEGLIKAFGEYTQEKQFCSLGSVKSNIGHLEAAAGIAALSKVLLQIKYKKLVPSLHSKKLNSNINFINSPFFVQQEFTDWDMPSIEENGQVRTYPRRAGISSFGAGGANAHIIVEEYNSTSAKKNLQDNGPEVIVLSAKNEERLKDYVLEMYEFLEKESGEDSFISLADIAYTLQNGREAMEERLAIVVESKRELVEKLKGYYRRGPNGEGTYRNSSKVFKQKTDQAESFRDDKELMAKAIIGRDYKKLAELWTYGVDVNWDGLRKNQIPKRISLPVYPFEKRRCWFNSYENNSSDSSEKIENGECDTKQQEGVKKWEDAKTGERSANRKKQDESMLMKPMNCGGMAVNDSETVTLEIIDDQIALITIQDRENKNMFSDKVINGLKRRFSEVRQNTSIKVIIVTGYDNIFCMGGTQEQLTGIAEQKISFTDEPFLYRGLLETEIPVISAIQGHASGGGLLFGLYADIIVMSIESVYSAVFMKYGFTPGMGATYILKEKLGNNLAAEMMYTARMFTGDELKDRTASVIFRNRDHVLKEALSIARILCEKPINALKSLKKELAGRILENIPSVIERETQMHAETFKGAEVKDRINYYFDPQSRNSFRNPLSHEKDSAVGTVEFKNKEGIYDKVSAILADVLHVQKGDLTSDISFKDMGVDSISGVEIIRDINKAFSISFDAVIIYEYPTIEKLVGHIFETIKAGSSYNRSLQKENPENIDYSSVSTMYGAMDSGRYPYMETEGIYEKLSEVVQKTLHLKKDDIRPGITFKDLGVDSISNIEIVNNINGMFNLKLDSVVLYNYYTIEKLAEYIITIIGGSGNKFCKDSGRELLTIENGVLKDKQDIYDIQPPKRIKLSQKDELPGKTVYSTRNDMQKKIVLKSFSSTSKNDKTENPGDIAIIGASGRFPGAENLDEFWSNMANGVNSVTEIPKERWDIDLYYETDREVPGKTYSRYGGYLKDIDKFDPLFFNISPMEAEIIDPQQRLFLEEAWKALEDAGYSDESLSNIRCGVFVGATGSDYRKKLENSCSHATAEAFIGSSSAILAARISYFLNLTGPSVAIDTACSSSLVAIHQACQSINSAESDMAIAGGITLMTTPDIQIQTSKMGILSPEGKCKTFDSDADGTVMSEGVGVVVLKSLQRALQDGDHIYGVIKGSGINQDGKTNGITAPNAQSQTQLELEVYKRAGINPENISMVEAHGTATKLGDPIEIKALTDAFREYTQKKQFCAIGTVKTNIGHTTMSAGVAGLIKVLLSFKHKKIPPLIHYKNENEHINFKDSPFFVCTKLTDWETQNGMPRIAAVSSFGFSGTNCHIVVEEFSEVFEKAAGSKYPYYMIALSAKTEDALECKIRELNGWLSNKENEKYSIADISYTLLAGRSHFPVRYAFIVRDIHELKQKLMDFCKSDIAGKQFTNNGLLKPTTFGAILKETAEKLVKELNEFDLSNEEEYKFKLTELAEFYNSGVNFEWKNLFIKGQCHRISMPVYPFARERYWVHETNNMPEKCVSIEGIAKIHPLLGQNTSTLSENKFTVDLDVEEFYLKDHLVYGNKVLPGVAHIEMARAAGELAGERKVASLKNVVWMKPIVVKDKCPKAEIILNSVGEEVQFKVKCSEDGSRNDIYSQGEIIFYENDSLKPVNERMDIEGIIKRCSERVDGAECYRVFKNRQLNLGAGFQSIQQLFYNSDEAIAFIKLPEHLRISFDKYSLHPTLMDGALEAVIGLVGFNNKKQEILELPFCIDEVIIYGTLPERCYSYVHRAVHGNQNTDTKRFDVRFMDEDGNILVVFNGFSLRAVPHVLINGESGVAKEDSSLVKEENCEKMYFRWEWEETPNTRDIVVHGNFLLFDTSENTYNALYKWQCKNGSNGSKIVLVTPGERYCEHGQYAYEINTLEQDDYRKLIESLASKNLLPRNIIHNWSGKANETRGTSLEGDLDRGIYSMFLLSRTLIEKRLDNKIQLIYVHTGTKENPESQFAAVAGFSKTLRVESTKLVCRTLQLHPELEPGIALNCILKELIDGNTDLEVSYGKDGRRFVKHAKEFVPPNQKSQSLLLKDRGVYIITGGLGGLGLIFSKYLAEKVKARLVLTGRSSLNAECVAKLKELENAGAEVVYIRADVSVRADVIHLMEEARRRFNEINGIIHSAGVLKDAYIQNKTLNDFKYILAPKVYGTVNLDNVSKDDNLDFFVTFSSIASAIGNIGQCDYSFANSYLDYYAVERETLRLQSKRKGKSLSINWPPWKDGGMKADDSNMYHQVMIYFQQNVGASAIDSAYGLEAFEAGLMLEDSCFMPIKGNRSKLMTLLGVAGEAVRDNYRSADNVKIDLSARVLRELTEISMSILKLNEKIIDPDTDLSQYGLNSINFTDFTNRINRKFSIRLTPALFFEYTTLRSLSEYISEEYEEVLKEYFKSDMGVEGALAEEKISTQPQVLQELPEKSENIVEDMGNKITRDLLEITGSILNESKIHPDTKLSEYGLNSMTFIDFTNKINSRFNIRLTPAIFFEYETVGSLSQYLLEEYKDTLEAHYSESMGDKELLPEKKQPYVETQQSRNIQSIREKDAALIARDDNNRNEPVAIIGMGGIMPQSEDLESFWENLVAVKDLITEIPADRWNWKDYYGTGKNKTMSICGGFINDVDKFDAGFFGISDEEADYMDPQQRLFLQTVWKTIEDAGYKAKDLSGTDTGVFVGTATIDYYDSMKENSVEIKAYTSTGISHCILANRVSYLLDLRGPSEPVDTACSSSLVALHRAVESIMAGECEMAIAGGVNIISSPLCNISFGKAGMLSPDGKCKTFDSQANGYVRGEGVGAVLLKPLKKAQADGDHIYAVIKGTAVNHGGYVSSLTIPNPVAQAELIEKVFEKAQVSPDTVTYIEAHGTGTSLGDPIEIHGLKKAFVNMFNRKGIARKEAYCGIGALKTNIGHLETAAGIAGIIKVILAMKHKCIPGNVHLQEINPFIELKGSPFFLVRETIPWKTLKDEVGREIPRRAGISSFGFGGANAHVLLEEYENSNAYMEKEGSKPQIIVLSAKNEERLKEYANSIFKFIKRGSIADDYTQIDRDCLLEKIQSELQTMASKVLTVDVNDIDTNESISSYGFDRISFFELINKINEKYSIEFIDDVFNEGLSLAYLAQHLIEKNKPALLKYYSKSDEEAIEIRNGFDISLEDIAFTLQAGREEMEERLAIVAGDIGELYRVLEQYCNGNTNCPNLFRGTVTRDNINPAQENNQNAELIASAVASNELTQLAKLWVSGAIIDWRSLHKQQNINWKPARVSLPTYPFAKERHWFQKQKNSRKTNTDKYDGKEPIAIVGVSGIFPGSKDINEFWLNLEQQKDLITEVPLERWNYKEYYSESNTDRNKTNSKWGGFIGDADKFDAKFFNISPKEAELMDPQQRVALETVWSAIEDSGYRAEELSGRKIGVFMGVQFSDYHFLLEDEGIDHPYITTGNANAMISNRISYLLNLTGPSEVIDTACSSSAVAVRRAVKSIQNAECEMAIAGGVSLMLSPKTFLTVGKLGVLAPDGKCKTFDKSANGYVRGEGVGVLVMKPLSKAVEDHDNIYAVVLGTAENHGGKANSLTAPNTKAQTELLLSAYTDSGIDPGSITYIETHGTGTELGDPVEIEALKKAFKQSELKSGNSKGLQCGLGSVKANIGHLEPASGIAGIIKVILAMKNEKLPGMVHFKELNPYIKIENSNFYIVEKTKSWDRLTDEAGNIIPLRAGVSSFGIGGTCVHVVLEEYKNRVHRKSLQNEQNIFILSARTPDRLKEYAVKLSCFVENVIEKSRKGQEILFEDIAYTLQTGRENMQERLAIIASDIEELNKCLKAFCEGNESKGNIYVTSTKITENKPESMLKLQDIIEQRDLIELAKLWVSGVNVEWKLLYKGDLPYKVSLPTYPFVRERHWVRNTQTNKIEDTKVLSKVHYYHSTWEESPLQLGINREDTGGILVFDTEETLKEEIASRGKQVMLVRPGYRYKELQNCEYEINPASETDYLRLAESLKIRGFNPDQIIHMWAGEVIDDNGISMESSLNMGVYSVFYLTKALMTQKAVNSTRLIYIHPAGTYGSRPQNAAISGLAKTIRMENPNFKYKTLELDAFVIAKPDRILKLALEELEVDDGNDTEIKYDGKRRLVRRLIEYCDPENDENSVQLKDGGTYLITGGTGSLGMIFANYIAGKVKAKLVLAGWSDLTPESEIKIKHLEEKGAEVVYIKADLSNRQDVDSLIRQIKLHFNELNGVIHSAGVYRNGFVINKAGEDMRTVLAPKVYGVVYLDEVLKDEKLDFFIMFSSIAAVLGKVGQCDYAYANNFMDCFAENRENLRKRHERCGRTIAINWPFWKDGGMTASPDEQKILFEQAGMEMLPSEVGIEAFEFAMKHRNSQYAVIYGDRAKFNSFFTQTGQQLKRKMPGKIAVNASILSKKTEEFLKGAIAKETGIPLNKIEAETGFDEFGIDSIVVNRFNAEMKAKLGDLPKTLLYEYNTIKDLTSYLVKNYEQNLIRFFEIPDENNDMEEESETSKCCNKKISQLTVSTERKKIDTAQREEGKDDSEQDIAIIGISGRYPGAENLEELWQNLKDGKDCITEIPSARWDYLKYYDENYEKPELGKMYCKWGGFIDNADGFDPLFFNIAPSEAESMDPQERVLLEVVWSAFENAGYSIKRLKKVNEKGNSANVGVFAAVTSYTYQLWAPEQWSKGNYIMPNTSPWSIANRISYVFNFKGPSMPVDTACSSGITAIHLACESLKKGECELAVAGGVNLYLHPYKYASMCYVKMLSPTGRCHTFGADADGFVPGEGAGAVILKPLDKAVQDGDYIYGVIKGTSLNHGGKTNGYTVPNPNAQAELISTALKKSNIDPRTISYIEAHGTGTALGDPIEIAGLTKAFREYTEDCQFCSIGSVKSNIGHLEAASGIVGLTKVLLQMKNKLLVPSIYSEELNSNINFNETPFYVQHKLEKWEQPVLEIDGMLKKFPRRAGISSFGAGGANAHIIVEEYENLSETQQRSHKPEQQIFVLSARNEERLKAYAKCMADFLRNAEKNCEFVELEDISCTLQMGRIEMEDRLAFIADSTAEVIKKLEKFYNGDMEISDFIHGRVKKKPDKQNVESLINSYIKEGRLIKLAEEWVNGAEIDWRLINKGRIFKRIPLPSYPFKRNRFWFRLISKDEDEKNIQLQFPEKDAQLVDSTYKENNEQLNKLFYGTSWVQSPLKSRQQVNSESLESIKSTVVLIYTKDSIDLKNVLDGMHKDDEVWEIELGAIYEKADDRSWKINFENKELLESCIRSIGNIDRIYFLTGIQKGEYDIDNIEALEFSQKVGVLGAFRLIKSLLNCGRSYKNLVLKVITNGVYEVMAGEMVRPYHAGLIGFVRTAAKEHPWLRISCIDISFNYEKCEDIGNIAMQIVSEDSGNKENVIALRNGKRYVKVLKPLKLDEERKNPFVLNGVYVIIGGLGSIGYDLACYLSDTVHANLVLIGRSELDKDKKERLSSIGSKGGRAIYIRADVSDELSMKTAIEKTRNIFGKINGVVHSAMVHSNIQVQAMDEETLIGTLKPKVRGSVILHRVLKGEDIDFLIFFSSGQTFAVNAGTSHYAAACSFKDSYALCLKDIESYKVKIINWGYWGTIKGIPLRKAYKDYADILDEQGVKPITPQIGMEALKRLLSSNLHQVFTFNVKDYVLELMGVSTYEKLHQLSTKQPEEQQAGMQQPGLSQNAHAVGTREIKKYIECKIKDTIAEVLKIDDGEIEIDRSFMDFGVDSILGAKVVDNLNRKLYINLKTSNLFDYSTISRLTAFIADMFSNDIIKHIESNAQNDAFEGNIGLKYCSAAYETKQSAEESSIDAMTLFYKLSRKELSVEEVQRYLEVKDR